MQLVMKREDIQAGANVRGIRPDAVVVRWLGSDALELAHEDEGGRWPGSSFEPEQINVCLRRVTYVKDRTSADGSRSLGAILPFAGSWCTMCAVLY